MNVQSEKNTAIEGTTLAQIEVHGMVHEQACAADILPVTMPVKNEPVATASPTQAIGTLYFGSSYCATSPKTHELKMRYAAICALEGNGQESAESVQC